MKKIFTLAIISGLFLNSCRKADTEVAYTPAITGVWKISKIAVISGKDSNILNSLTMQNCSTKNGFEFRKDNSSTYSEYTGINCESVTKQESTYDYQNSPTITKLVIKDNNQTAPDTYIVTKLTELELQMYDQEQTDFNNDGILDKIFIYMHK